MPQNKKSTIMIQRIQTIYLFITFIVILLMLFFPLAEFLEGNELAYLLNAGGVKDISGEGNFEHIGTYPIALLISIIALTSLITIFLFKRRDLQIRLCIYNMVFMLGSIGMIYFYTSNIANETQTSVQYALPSILPFITIIFTLMALRNIRKDDKKVKSMNRIR